MLQASLDCMERHSGSRAATTECFLQLELKLAQPPWL